MAQILVTGVAGFIGSHLAERLIQDGHSVVGVDCFTPYYPRAVKERNISYLQPLEKFTFVEGDLLTMELGSLLTTNARVEYVFHLAGQPGVRASWGREFDDYLRLNVLATQRLLESTTSLPLKKFVLASSSSIYGDAEKFPTPEDIVPRPVSPYGVTKLAGEHLVNLYARNYRIPSVALRFFSVYGPRQRPDMAFHRFICAMKNDEEITVYGDGEQTRDFTYVGDIVEGVVRAGFSNVAGKTFNLGGGSQVSLKQTIGMLERIMNRPARVKHLQAQQGDARNTSADIRQAANMFGYEPGTTLEQGLRRQVDSLKDSA